MFSSQRIGTTLMGAVTGGLTQRLAIGTGLVDYLPARIEYWTNLGLVK